MTPVHVRSLRRLAIAVDAAIMRADARERVLGWATFSFTRRTAP